MEGWDCDCVNNINNYRHFPLILAFVSSVRSKALSCLSTAAGSCDNAELLSALMESLSAPIDADSLLVRTPGGRTA